MAAVPSRLPGTERWDLQSGKEIVTFTEEKPIISCAVTPDGQAIIAGEDSGRVHFLQLVEHTGDRNHTITL